MTDEQRDIIQHSLGLSHPKAKGKAYRNRYCTVDGDARLEAMVTAGWMEHGAKLNSNRDRYYHVTEAGAAAVGSKLPED